MTEPPSSLIPLSRPDALQRSPAIASPPRLNVARQPHYFAAAIDFSSAGPPTTGTSFIDDLNIVFILLNTFVGFTTSAFSASYIAHELETGRLTPAICASTTPCSSSCCSA